MANIFASIFGDTEFSSLNQKLDNLSNIIPSNKPHENNLEDVSGKLVDSFLSNSSDKDVSQLFQEVQVPQDRLARYGIYDEINKSVPIIKRILKTYISNLVPKNPVDGKCIVYRDHSKDETQKKTYENAKQFAKDVIEKYKFIHKLKTFILPRRLLYGDSFVEILDVHKEMDKVNLNQQQNSSLITESTNLLNSVNKLSVSSNKSLTDNEVNYYLDSIVDLMVEFEAPPTQQLHEYVNVIKFTNDSEGIDGKQEELNLPEHIDMDDVLMRMHKPHSIIVLDSQYGSRMGYIEVSKKEQFGSGITENLSQVIGRLTLLSKRQQVLTQDKLQERMVNRLVLHVLKKLVKVAKDKAGESNVELPDTDSAIKFLGEDVYEFMKRMFVEQGLYKKENSLQMLKIRFIPPNRMVQFTTTSIDYAPYGESVIESLVLPCKLFMLSQLSNAITKLSRASLIRKWKLDEHLVPLHSDVYRITA